MLESIADNEEMRFQYSMMDVKMAIEYHGIHAVMDALFSDNKYKNELQKYLTAVVNCDKIVTVD
jgi:hypothetical protein